MASARVSKCRQFKPWTLKQWVLFFTLLSALGAESKPPPPSRSPPRSPPKTKSPPPTTSSKSPRRAPSPIRKPSPRLPPSPRPPPRMPPSPKPPARSGIRLVGGSTDGVGRLEILIEKGSWTAVCGLGGATGRTDGSEPQILCGLLGYRFGRLYYGGAGFNNYTNAEVDSVPWPQILIGCSLKYPRDEYWPAPFADVGEYTCDFERLPMAPPKCRPQTADLVALQCSNSKLPQTPPPTPPTRSAPPPPSPFEVKQSIRLLPVNSAVGRFVELLVNISSDGHTGPAVWAPLCAPEGDINNEILADTLCLQANVDRPLESGFLISNADSPQVIQKGNVTTNGFNPTKYTHWLTVVGGVKEGLYAVQQMDLKVTTTVCASGLLFRTTCTFLMP